MEAGRDADHGNDVWAAPLSDHADYTDLVRYVELVSPARVLTLHGFAGEFARDLRERGLEAWALTEDNQMELGFGNPGSVRDPGASTGDSPTKIGAGEVA